MIGLAVVIPAAVAGIIAWQLFDGDAVPTPTVTRVITPPAQSVDVQAPTAAAIPAATSTDLSESATALDTTVTVTAVTTSDTSESEADTPIVAVAELAQAVDLSSLDPAARLAAWTDIERIQVVSGESLWLIAHTYETTVSAIATLNGITDSESLSVGQELVIPVGFGEEIVAAATPVAVDDGGTTTTTTSTSSDLDSWTNIASVTVEDGDSLDAIARANNTSIEAIMALNGLTNSNLIYVGDVLRIPVGYQGEVPGIDLGTQKVVADTQVSERTDEEVATPTTHGDDMLAEDDEAGANDMLDADDGSHSYSMSE